MDKSCYDCTNKIDCDKCIGHEYYKALNSIIEIIETSMIPPKQEGEEGR